MSDYALRKAFQETEDGFVSLVQKQWTQRPQIAAVGSCCLVGAISGSTLYVASLGDSRAVLGSFTRNNSGIQATQISTEHNASIEAVRNELMANHPEDSHIVMLKHGVWRVKGIIQVFIYLILTIISHTPNTVLQFSERKSSELRPLNHEELWFPPIALYAI